jgi:hypothetical protein
MSGPIDGMSSGGHTPVEITPSQPQTPSGPQDGYHPTQTPQSPNDPGGGQNGNNVNNPTQGGDNNTNNPAKGGDNNVNNPTRDNTGGGISNYTPGIGGNGGNGYTPGTGTGIAGNAGNPAEWQKGLEPGVKGQLQSNTLPSTATNLQGQPLQQPTTQAPNTTPNMPGSLNTMPGAPNTMPGVLNNTTPGTYTPTGTGTGGLVGGNPGTGTTAFTGGATTTPYTTPTTGYTTNPGATNNPTQTPGNTSTTPFQSSPTASNYPNTPTQNNPTNYNPASNTPNPNNYTPANNASSTYNPNTYNPNTYNPNTYNPNTYNPNNASNAYNPNNAARPSVNPNNPNNPSYNPNLNQPVQTQVRQQISSILKDDSLSRTYLTDGAKLINDKLELGLKQLKALLSMGADPTAAAGKEILGLLHSLKGFGIAGFGVGVDGLAKFKAMLTAMSLGAGAVAFLQKTTGMSGQVMSLFADMTAKFKMMMPAATAIAADKILTGDKAQGGKALGAGTMGGNANVTPDKMSIALKIANSLGLNQPDKAGQTNRTANQTNPANQAANKANQANKAGKANAANKPGNKLSKSNWFAENSSTPAKVTTWVGRGLGTVGVVSGGVLLAALTGAVSLGPAGWASVASGVAAAGLWQLLRQLLREPGGDSAYRIRRRKVEVAQKEENAKYDDSSIGYVPGRDGKRRDRDDSDGKPGFR